MPQKLTLSADPEVIRKAKELAAKEGTSVSALFERWTILFTKTGTTNAGFAPHKEAPSELAQSVSGIIELDEAADERSLLTDALLEKHDLDQ